MFCGTSARPSPRVTRSIRVWTSLTVQLTRRWTPCVRARESFTCRIAQDSCRSTKSAPSRSDQPTLVRPASRWPGGHSATIGRRSDLDPVPPAEVVGGGHEGHVQLAGAQPVQLLQRTGLGEPDGDAWVSPVEALEQGGHVDRAQALFGADPQLAGQGPGHPDDRVPAGTGLAE